MKSLYLIGKTYFTQLSNQGHPEAMQLMDEYSEIKQQCGDFIAAKFLRDVYVEFELNMKEIKNG